MIDEKRIEEEAYKETNFYNVQESVAFIAGANWAEEEFIKELWHTTNEEPFHKKMCIAQNGFNSNDYILFELPFNISWDDFVLYNILNKWCYVDDILPKG